MKLLSEGQLRFYVVQPIHLIPWLLLFFILKSLSFLAPARLSVYQKKAFYRCLKCSKRSVFDKIQYKTKFENVSGDWKATGQGKGANVTIFNVNRSGYSPRFPPQGVPVNGGLPQNISLQVHLEKADRDIIIWYMIFIPTEDFMGLLL